MSVWVSGRALGSDGIVPTLSFLCFQNAHVSTTTGNKNVRKNVVKNSKFKVVPPFTV